MYEQCHRRHCAFRYGTFLIVTSHGHTLLSSSSRPPLKFGITENSKRHSFFFVFFVPFFLFAKYCNQDLGSSQRTISSSAVQTLSILNKEILHSFNYYNILKYLLARATFLCCPNSFKFKTWFLCFQRLFFFEFGK